jgi:hypothetical protein
VAHAGQPPDHQRDPLQRPQLAGEPVGRGAGDQGLLDGGSCWSDSRGAGPLGPLLRSPSVPLACQRARQTLTAWAETPSWPAISAWRTPAANSSAAQPAGLEPVAFRLCRRGGEAELACHRSSPAKQPTSNSARTRRRRSRRAGRRRRPSACRGAHNGYPPPDRRQRSSSDHRRPACFKGAGCSRPSPASDLGRAQAWYADKLGLTPDQEEPEALLYRSGADRLFLLFASSDAGTAQHQLGAWLVEDLAAEVAELRGRGVVFEDYDQPGLARSTASRSRPSARLPGSKTARATCSP